jgi:hypothetical protein
MIDVILVTRWRKTRFPTVNLPVGSLVDVQEGCAVAAGGERDNSRKVMVSVRLDPDEEAALKAEAAQHGETLSQYVRNLLVRRDSSARLGVVDYRSYPVSSTGTPANLALEAENGMLIPRTAQPYVSSLTPR